MIISRTPFRISFAGGGSDLREFYRHEPGVVLSVTLKKYVYLSMHDYFSEDRYFLKYSQSELVDSVDAIQHRIVREVFKIFGVKGIDFNSSADFPAGTGMGSSSSFAVGLVNLCNAFTGRTMTTGDLAEMACHVEIDRLQEPIGKQDQYACAFGDMNLITFHEDDKVTVSRVNMRKSARMKLQYNLLLFYLGQTRAASSVLLEQRSNIINDKAKFQNLQKMVRLALVLNDELTRGNVDAMGEILHAGWMYKKELAQGISNGQIDHYYEVALRNGAAGGKLLGAGGAGFLLFYVPEDRQEAVRLALADLRECAVEFDEFGSTIVDLVHLPEASLHRRSRVA